VRFAVFLSATLAALSGAMLTAFLSNINPALGDQLMVKGVALVVVGGMGSLLGAVVAAFVVGIGESLSVGYLGSSWRESVALILLLLILLFRPSGLFGRSDMERL
jgi:branched-chain amino acid transport system permease protein